MNTPGAEEELLKIEKCAKMLAKLCEHKHTNPDALIKIGSSLRTIFDKRETLKKHLQYELSTELPKTVSTLSKLITAQTPMDICLVG